jgi:hypothetical protein
LTTCASPRYAFNAYEEDATEEEHTASARSNGLMSARARINAIRGPRRPDDRNITQKRQGRSLAEARNEPMRRIAYWTSVAAIAAGCQQAPVTKPRILSVQSPAGMPPAAALNTTRNNPLIVPTAPVAPRTGVVAPAVAVPIPQPPPGVIAPPAGIQVPAAPGGVQGVMQPNTIAPPPLQYQQPGGVVPVVPGASSLKAPERLPGPVADSAEAQNGDNH